MYIVFSVPCKIDDSKLCENVAKSTWWTRRFSAAKSIRHQCPLVSNLRIKRTRYIILQNTRGSVLTYLQTWKGLLNLVWKDWEVIYQTRVGVFHRISKPRSDILNTRGSTSSDTQSPRSDNLYQKRVGVFHRISILRSDIFTTRRCVLNSYSSSPNGLFTQRPWGREE